MTTTLDIQIASDSSRLPEETQLCGWVEAALAALNLPSSQEISLRIVDEGEMAELNQTYRQKQGSTNVLSFPSPPDMPVMPDGAAEEGGETERILGDIALARQTIWAEAEAQQKTPQAHLSHLLVHGLLHLLGHDHIDDEEAARMEQAEITILAEMNIANPYTIIDEPI